MPRISLDVTQGTFVKLGDMCREEYRTKAEVLRELLNQRLMDGGVKGECRGERGK